jgi:hypothetical protein
LLLSKRNQFSYAERPVASARCVSCHVIHRQLLRLAQARRRLLHLAQARHRLLRLRHASGCLGMSHSSSRGSSLTTSPHAGSSLTTSPMSRVRLLRHVARLVAGLIIDYYASRRLVVDYFAYAARPGDSARRAARHAARRRLLSLRRVSGCLGTSRGLSSTTLTTPRVRLLRLVAGSSHGPSSTTSPPLRVRVPRHIARLVVDYFDYAACPVASARHTARHCARRRVLRLA